MAAAELFVVAGIPSAHSKRKKALSHLCLLQSLCITHPQLGNSGCERFHLVVDTSPKLG